MTDIVLSSGKECIFKESLLFMFDLAYKIRFSLPLLLFASFFGFDFQIQVVTEEDDDQTNETVENYEDLNTGIPRYVFDLNTGIIREFNEDQEETSDENSNTE